ncbi:MAG: hypothetical protein M5R40_21775 [Anaerolineae bacterium]|nr:hypothetical protein [Anaerolineae bacterium]
MRLVLSLEHRFDRTPDGAVWTQTAFAHSFLCRYLDVFDHVRVVARVRETPSVGPDWKRADGEGVSFVPLPHYVGPYQYALQAREVHRVAQAAVRPEDAVILRVGSQIANAIVPMLRRSGHPYGLEVVNDPYDIFAPGAVRHPLRPCFAGGSLSSSGASAREPAPSLTSPRARSRGAIPPRPTPSRLITQASSCRVRRMRQRRAMRISSMAHRPWSLWAPLRSSTKRRMCSLTPSARASGRG